MFDIKLHDDCDKFAQVFSLSVNRGYDSIRFIQSVMTDESLEAVIFSNDKNEKEILSDIENRLNLDSGLTLSNFMMWFMGYTYMYWMLRHNLKPNEVYKILPVEKFIKRFNIYHTESCDFVIKDSIKRYKEKE